ncbi:MAG: hypothetical protein KF708_11985 [Pirellulales bacterium]|nr:hypothetical protein [Pirellulales bacterium]
MKNVDDLLPLAPLQALQFAHALAEPDSPLLVEQLRATLEGPLDVALFRRAWETIAARHAMLRAAPAWEGLKKPVLVVHKQIELPFSELDWRAPDVTEQHTRLAAWAAEDRRQGFDLRRAPLWRIQLIRLGDERWQLLWTCHHLLLDGWSVGIVLREVFTWYAAQRQEQSMPLPPAAPFRDFHTWLKRQDHPASEQFWREQLAGCTPLGGLPLERAPFEPRPDRTGHGEIERHLSPEDTARLRERAKTLRVGESAWLQTAWAILLGRHFEREELLFGVAVAGRPHSLPLVDAIVGPFVNNVPLRVTARLDDAWSDVCRTVQAAGRTAQAHEHVPLDAIARAAGMPPERRLFETLVVLENYPLGDSASRQIGALQIRDIHGTATSAYSLTLVALPGEELGLRLLYDTKRWSETTARAVLEQFLTLLAQMSEQPEARVRDLSLTASAPRELADEEGRLSVRDIAGQPAPSYLPGELWYSRAGSAPRPTGYRAQLLADGEIEYLGPGRASLRVGRFAIDPDEIVRVLELHPLVARGAVVGTSSRTRATQLAAYVEPASGARVGIDSGDHGLLLGQLRRFAEARLPAPLLPLAWRVVDKLPLDAQGVLDTTALPEPMRARGETSTPYVAPRDAVEARVAEIWSQALGVEPVGVNDSFIDLGGYSSLAVTLLARLEDEFARRLPLAALFEEPTVAHLAKLLGREAATPEEISLVPLRAGGGKPALFCVHPAGGTVFCYLELAQRLSDDRPVYGLQAAGIDGTTAPHETIEAMAAHYLSAIKSAQPTGPYHLCGWSTGGVVAFELARQMRAAGDEVGLLALLDAAIPRPGESFGADDLLPMLELLFPTDDRQVLERLREMPASAQLEHFRGRAEAAQLLIAGAGASQAKRIYEVFQANMQAVVAYRPGPYDRRITLFRAADHATPMHADRTLGWEPWASGGIELHDVAGEHLNLLKSPTVLAICVQLQHALGEDTRSPARHHETAHAAT